MKKRLSILALVVLLTGCGLTAPVVSAPQQTTIGQQTTQNTTHNTTTVEPYYDDGSVSAEDKEMPDSYLDYMDYGDYGDILPDDPDMWYDESKWYVNKISEKIKLPDPFVLPYDEDGDGHDDCYYVYGTTDRQGSQTLDTFKTYDFNTFDVIANIHEGAVNNWSASKRSFFAPEIYEINGEFYLYYSDNHQNGRRYISVMKGPTPEGPFTECGVNAPCFDHTGKTTDSALDQTLYIDEATGQMWMYFSIYDSGSTQYIVGAKMTSPTSIDWNTYKLLVSPGSANPKIGWSSSDPYYWETYHSGFPVAEGPIVIKSPVNGKYYMIYSVNHNTDICYTPCYAVSTDPLGSFQKPYTGQPWSNLFFGYAGNYNSGTVFNQWDGFVTGVGHPCVFETEGQWMVGYHAFIDRGTHTSGESWVAKAPGVDHMVWDKTTGEPHVNAPTYSLQPIPEAVSSYKNLCRDNIDYYNVDNVTNADKLFDGKVNMQYHLSAYDSLEVNLGSGKSYVEIIFDDFYWVGGISIYNASAYGDTIDEIEFINFGDGNAIIDGKMLGSYVNDSKQFVFPGSGYVYDFEDIYTDHCVIAFNNASAAKINEIMILGCE